MKLYDTRLMVNVVRARLARNFYKLNFMITSACNSRCKTCNIWQNDKSVIDKDMKLEDIKKVFKNLPRPVCWLSFTGGEPMLRNDLLEIFESAVENVPRLCLIGMPTNGLMTERTVKRVKELSKLTSTKIIISFSLDGPPKVHDKIRGIPGAFKKTWKTYQECRKIASDSENLEVILETTLSPLNIEYAYNFLNKLLSRGNKVTLTIAHDGFLYKGVGKSIMLTEDYFSEIERISDLYLRHLPLFSPSGLIERRYIKNIIRFIKEPKKMIVPCKAMSSSFALLSDGEVTPCFMWGTNLGNIKKNGFSFKKISSSAKAKTCERAVKQGKCPVCWTPCEAYQSIISSMLKGRIW